MSEVIDRTVKEQVKLEDGKSGDLVTITPSAFPHSWYIGSVFLVKVKSIINNKTQIKYRYKKGGRVLKANVPGGLTVTRTRNWVPEDGPEAGVFVKHGRIYTIDPEDPTKIRPAIVASDRGRTSFQNARNPLPLSLDPAYDMTLFPGKVTPFPGIKDPTKDLFEQMEQIYDEVITRIGLPSDFPRR